MDNSPILSALILGIIEGLTEFLPVSSTGHLILGEHMLGFKDQSSPAFNIVIQLGAILAVLVAYRERLTHVVVGCVRGESQSMHFARNILLAFMPAVVIGLFAYKAIRTMLDSPFVVAIALVAGGVAILLIERLRHKVSIARIEDMPARAAVSIGLVQCLAMIPGVSRSGATIMGALLLGVERRTAAEFSFFLAIPTMLAASGLALFKNWDTLNHDDLTLIAIGFVASFLVALVVVKAFVLIVGRYGFTPFGWYRILVGGIALYYFWP